jgi:hypothetical protein
MVDLNMLFFVVIVPALVKLFDYVEHEIYLLLKKKYGNNGTGSNPSVPV